MEGAWRLLLLACLIGMAQSTNITAECSDSEVGALVQLGAEHANAVTGRRRRRRRRRRSSDGTTRRRRSKGTDFPYVLQAYCGGSWLTLCSDVPSGWQQHPGAFDTNIATTPYAATSDSNAADNYITLGGSKVEGTLPSSGTIEGWFADSNANNLDFDMEGVLNGAFSTVATLTEQVQESSSDTKAQVTCLVGTYSTAEPYSDTFDYFGIMIHGNSMTSGSYSIPESDPTQGGTWPYIKNWLDSDIPNSKIILSLTTVDLTGYMVDWFKSLIAEYGLAGMSFWYWDELDSSISLDCIEWQSVQCDSSDSFACEAVCAEGDYYEQCCDKTDMTTLGSCTSLGQEGCCGGTSETTYCQAVSLGSENGHGSGSRSRYHRYHKRKQMNESGSDALK